MLRKLGRVKSMGSMGKNTIRNSGTNNFHIKRLTSAVHFSIVAFTFQVSFPIG